MKYIYTKLADLKNRARRIAREEGVPRQLAHEIAARRGNFKSYSQARKVLPNEATPTYYPVEIRQIWREHNPRRHGVGSFTVLLKSPLDALLRPHHMVQYLAACEIVNAGHLASDGFMRDLDETRIDLGKMARTLQFIDATGLKPSSAKRIYPKGSWYNRPPISDHDHGWYDPEARVHILSTEPYRDSADTDPEHHIWEERWGWSTLRVAWGSIYGFDTTLYLLCPNSYLPQLREKIVRLEQSPIAVQTKAISIDDPGTPLSTY